MTHPIWKRKRTAVVSVELEKVTTIRQELRLTIMSGEHSEALEALLFDLYKQLGK